MSEQLVSLRLSLKKWERNFQKAHGRKATKSDVETSPDEIQSLYQQYSALRRGQNRHGNTTSKELAASGEVVKEEEKEDDGVFGPSLNKPKNGTERGAGEEVVDKPVRKSIWNLPPPPAAVMKLRKVSAKVSRQRDAQAQVADVKKVAVSKKEAVLLSSPPPAKRPSSPCVFHDDKELGPPLENEGIPPCSEPHPLPDRSPSPIPMAGCGRAGRGFPRSQRGGTSKEWLERCKPDLCDLGTTVVSDKSSKHSSRYPLRVQEEPSSKQSSRCPLRVQEDSRGNSHPSEGALAKLYNDKPQECASFEAMDTEEAIGASNGENDASTFGRKTTRKPETEETIGVSNGGNSTCTFGGKTSRNPESRPHAEELKDSTSTSEKAERMADVSNSPEESVPMETSLPTVKGKAVSENFVKLNMKVKRYSRRPGRSLSGSAYKRQEWKKRQRGQDKATGGGGGGKGGRFVCFKCGGSGHWARNCKERGGVSNLGTFSGQKVGFDERVALGFEEEMDRAVMEELEEECPFPTLAQAAKMVSSAAFSTDNDSMGSGSASVMQCEDYENDMTLTTPPGVATPHSGPPTLPPPPDLTMPRIPASMEPLFKLENGNIPSTPTSVMSALRKLGFAGFRPRQEEAVMRILSGVSTLLVTSTGSGKSFCYQLPAYLYARTRPPCITLVISPLVSLMDDQVRQFPKGLKGACLHTNQTRPQRARVLKEVAEGHVNVLLLSPEALVGGALWSRREGPSLHDLPPVAFACIDEAHCISEWSHNFRPSYLRLHKVLRERFGVRCVLGLTATATHVTSLSIASHLGVAEGDIIRGPELPDNLHITVSCDQDRDQALVDLLEGPIFRDLDSIIVYCTRQQTAETLAQILRTCLQPRTQHNGGEPADHSRGNSVSSKGKGGRRQKAVQVAECYHAGMAAAQRRSIQNKFMSGSLRIVVATVAFGMGLNKADIRAVIHYNIPRSFESFVQEMGRAGRDGNPAYCHVFIDKEGRDLYELNRHIYSDSVDPYAIKKLVEAVFPVCHCASLPQHHETNPATTEPESGEPKSPRRCKGHEVAVPIEATVQGLDTREECLATLLCHLELQGWIRVRNHTFDTCMLKCYGGSRQLRALAGKVPAVAAAVALLRERGEEEEELGRSNRISFSVTDVASRMGWESKVVRSELSSLEVNDRGTCPTAPQGARGSVIIEMEGLAFSLVSPGDLSTAEREELITLLKERVCSRERRELEKLQLLQGVLRAVASETHSDVTRRISDTPENIEHKTVETPNDVGVSLKEILSQYFSQEGLTAGELAERGIPLVAMDSDLTADEEEAVGRDVATLVARYSDQQFTGRAIARLFHGIPSPLYPAVVWGAQHGIWRKYLHLDFNKLCRLATKKLLELR